MRWKLSEKESFSWRNIKTPSMLLMTINDDISMINKCFTPSEFTVFRIYTVLGIFLFLYFLYIIKTKLTFRKNFLRKHGFKSN